MWLHVRGPPKFGGAGVPPGTTEGYGLGDYALGHRPLSQMLRNANLQMQALTVCQGSSSCRRHMRWMCYCHCRPVTLKTTHCLSVCQATREELRLSHSLGIGIMSDAVETSPDMLPFGWSRSNSMGEGGVSKNLEDAGAR